MYGVLKNKVLYVVNVIVIIGFIDNFVFFLFNLDIVCFWDYYMSFYGSLCILKIYNNMCWFYLINKVL